MKHRGAFQEGTVGTILITGLVLFGIGTVEALVTGMAGVFRSTFTRTPQTGAINDAGSTPLMAYGIVLAAVGILMIAGAMAYGFITEFRSDTGVRRQIAGVKILARYAYHRDGSMVSEADLDVIEDANTYVRLLMPDGSSAEFKCSRTIYFQMGEGMSGDVVSQGKWIGSFSPYIGRQFA